MKKILMTAVAVMCCAMTIMAEPVSPSVAQQAAAKFLQAKGVHAGQGRKPQKGQWKAGRGKSILRVQCHRLTGVRHRER